MQIFFVENEDITGEYILLKGENKNHIEFSLRRRKGDTVFVCDKERNRYDCVIESFEKDCIRLLIRSKDKIDTDARYTAVLCQAIPKGNKIETIIQKATELGVTEIILFESRNCVGKINSISKLDRYRKIAKEAASQCGRGTVPAISGVLSFDEVLKTDHRTKLICYEQGGENPGRFFGSDDVCFMIGPEGGFCPEEIEKATESGWINVTLGKRILRTETASGFFLSALSFVKELGVEQE